MTTRTEILDQYIQANKDTEVGDDDVFAPQSPSLAMHWLRHLTGRPELFVPGNAIDWASAHDDALNDSINALSSVAVFYPAEVNDHADLLTDSKVSGRARLVPPTPGDIVVFEVHGSPYGTLGAYVSHDTTGFTVFTQGSFVPAEANAAVRHLDHKRHHPIGWWHVLGQYVHYSHGLTHTVAA